MAFHSLGSCLVVALVLLSLLFVLLMITSHDKRLAFCSKLIQSPVSAPGSSKHPTCSAPTDHGSLVQINSELATKS